MRKRLLKIRRSKEKRDGPANNRGKRTATLRQYIRYEQLKVRALEYTDFVSRSNVHFDMSLGEMKASGFDSKRGIDQAEAMDPQGKGSQYRIA